MRRIFWMIFLCMIISQSVFAYQLDVRALMVEYQVNPLAIDTKRPRFSWQVHERDTEQVWYRIMVAENEQDLEKKENLVWDSGRVESSQSNGIPYGGPPLKSRSCYFWSVKCHDSKGHSVESDPARFCTGVLNDDWIGKWIWEDGKVEPNDYAYFRKEFEIPDDPSRAIAFVSAHNLYNLFINGERVSGYVNPGSSNPYKSKYYLAYDITGFLKKGKNAIGLAAYYKGAFGQNYINAVPGMLFEAKIKCEEGSEVMLASGSDWRALAETPFDESAPFLSLRKHTAAEYYDARREPVGWKESGFDDPGWRDAQVVETGFRPRSQYMPESGIMEIIDPVDVTDPFPGVHVFDLGKEISGWPRIYAEGPAGTRIKIRCSDRLILGRASWSMANEPTLTNYDLFTLSGKGREMWEPLFGFRGFRYIEITGFPGIPTKENIKGVFAHTRLEQTAEFECSNNLLNQIYEISVHTQRMGMVGQLVDCVHREQSQWHADAQMQSGVVFYNFFDPHIVRKTLLDLKDGQFDDGRLPANYPSQIEPGFVISNALHLPYLIQRFQDLVRIGEEEDHGPFPSRSWQYYIPEWDLHYVPMLWRTYFFYNDLYILEDCWPVVKKQIQFFEGWRDESGLVKKSGDWHISDWPEDYAKMDSSGNYLTVENCLYYNTLILSSRIAGILGHFEQADSWRIVAGELKEAINDHLYDEEAGAYLDCSGSEEMHQGASVVALQYGIVPESEIDRVMAHVKGQGLGTSTYLTFNLMDMLYDYDEGEFAYELINRKDWPGWGYMINKGDHTTWESWNNLASRSHPFNAYLAMYFLSGICGIKPASPGWKEIGIRPHVDGNLEMAQGSLQTIAGQVSASWDKTEEGLNLLVSIPGNTRARVCIPVTENKSVRVYEGIRLIWQEGETGSRDSTIRFLEREKRYIDFSVGSGNYDFRTVVN
jgi:alpha-L-rhamnosidase